MSIVAHYSRRLSGIKVYSLRCVPPGHHATTVSARRHQPQTETGTMAKRLTSISNHKGLNDEELIAAALQILESRITYRVDKPIIQSPQESKDYVKLQLAERPYEVFACLFLDTRHRVLAFEELFRGTIDGCSVHPREVVKAALAHNAAAVILAHNHPSGNAEPSQADQRITERLRDALSLIDVRVLDHLVVGQEVVSFAERGLV